MLDTHIHLNRPTDFNPGTVADYQLSLNFKNFRSSFDISCAMASPAAENCNKKGD